MKTQMTVPQVILHVLFSVLLLLAVVECAKDLPSSITQHHYCHGCLATLQELLKKVPPSKKKGREATVMDVMENICSDRNFKTYTYSPPKTVKACKLLLEDNEEEIEKALTKYTGGEGEDLVKEICHELTRACVGVDVEEGDEAKFSDINLTEDGESDGKGGMSVKVDPATGKAVKDGKKKEAKTLSKSDKKKKDKKKKKGDTKKSKKVIRDDGKPGKPGVAKGALHNLNIDINDPDSVKRVMEQISKIKNDVEGGGGGRDEL